MGIPYSKQINAAFNQVTPLVASGYELLETVKNIAIIILVIQIGIITLLLLNLIALLGLLFSISPDLEQERKQLVTPAMKWIASWTLLWSERKGSILGTLFGLLAVVVFAYSIYLYHARQSAEEMAEDFLKGDEGLAETEGPATKEDDEKADEKDK